MALATFNTSGEKNAAARRRSRSTYEPNELPSRDQVREAVRNALFLVAVLLFLASFITLKALIAARVLS